jgi:histidinol-phosphate aminotransferase
LRALPGLVVHPSDANFFLVRVGERVEDLARELLARGVSVRAFKGAQGTLAGHVRITVGTPAEDDRLLHALGELLPRL